MKFQVQGLPLENPALKEMYEVTELAENNAALEAEETSGAEAEEAQDQSSDQTNEQSSEESADSQAVASADVSAEGADDASATSEVPESDEAASDEAASDEVASDEAASDEATSDEAAAEPEANLPARDADGFSSALTESEGLQRKHIPGGIGYEVIFVVRSGDQKLVDESSQRVRTLIEEQCEGAIDNVRASEVRRFAYPIKKETEGVYVVVNARFRPEHTGELDRYFKLDENVLRHMMLKEDN